MPVDRWKALATEVGANPEIPFPLYGFADFTRGKGLLDLKTSTRLGFKPQWLSQIVLYCLAENLPEWEVHLLTRNLKAARFKGTTTPEVARSVMNEIAYRAWEIKSFIDLGMKYLPELPGWHCKFCPLPANGQPCVRLATG